MQRIRIKKGLNLPITGEPVQTISPGNDVRHVALLGRDVHGLRPVFDVEEGDRVKLGQTLFTDRRMPRVRFTSPGSGRITAINRGARRVFLSIVIEHDGEEAVPFPSRTDAEILSLSRETVVETLLESGLWTVLRTRPFSAIPDPDTSPDALFVTAMDTNPLAPSVEAILADRQEDYVRGLQALSTLTGGPVYVCKAPGSRIPLPGLARLRVVEFDGPHPAGNVGTHIHFLHPARRGRTVWHLTAQDAADIGRLFASGVLPAERVVSLAGPDVKKPRLVRTRIGASLDDLTSDESMAGPRRVISGSLLSGHTSTGAEAFLGRLHQQVTVLPENRSRVLFGWLNPGLHLFSVKRMTAARFLHRQVDLTTAQHGGQRAIVPIGSYEKVMPLDILPTVLIRALASDDLGGAKKLGCLELDEEDLALCSLVCPSKIDHGANLRQVLSQIHAEEV